MENSLQLFDRAIGFYQTSRRMRVPDTELLNQAFYFGLHCFSTDKGFDLQRLYEVSPDVLLRQFYRYYQNYGWQPAYNQTLLIAPNAAEFVLLAVIWCLEDERSVRRCMCFTVLKERADERFLAFLSNQVALDSRLLELLVGLLKSKKTVDPIYFAGLFSAYGKKDVEDTAEFEAIYLGLERLSDPQAKAKYLIDAVKRIKEKSICEAFHTAHILPLVQEIADADGTNRILAETVLALAEMSHLPLKMRLELLKKYIVQVYDSCRQKTAYFENIVTRVLSESYMLHSETVFEILSQLQMQRLETAGAMSLCVLEWAEVAWRGQFLACDQDGTDFYEDVHWRFVEKVLSNRNAAYDAWMVLCCELALTASGSDWGYNPLPLWLALQIYRQRRADRFIEKQFLPLAKKIVILQCRELASYLEEPGNQIDWDEWSIALAYFGCPETRDAIAEVMQTIAYYDAGEGSKFRQWAAEHQLELKNWGCRAIKDPEREELMKLLAVN